MRILALNGSPRKDGSTARVLDEIGRIAEIAGAEVARYDLIDLDISDCRECMECKEGDGCVTEDDMAVMYDELQRSDVIILGSPVFMAAETGITKCFVDRLYALLGPRREGEFEKRLREGKKAIVVFTCGLADGHMVYNHLNTRYFSIFVKTLGCSDIRSFIIGGASSKRDVLGLPAARAALEETSRFLAD